MSKKYYGAETEKALKNFGQSQLPGEIIKAYAEVKKSAILSIQETESFFDLTVYNKIIESIDEIILGNHNENFPLPLLQGGAGTSINMCINEVISNLTNEKLEKENISFRINPIEHINKFQSTNDTFPTAVTIASLRLLIGLEKKVIELQEKLIFKEDEYSNILMCARTEMQDAVPITLGQVFGSWAGSIERDRWRLHKLKERLRTISLGGTAVGTSFSTTPKYIFAAEKNLRNITKLSLSRSQNFPDEISNQDKFSELASGMSLCAQNIFKIASDLQLYCSSFSKEMIHPDLQFGSTIMAAKTNPVILEFVRGLAIEIQCDADKIKLYSQNGQLQLNSFLPFIFNSIINCSKNLEKAIVSLLFNFLDLVKINKEQIEYNLIHSNTLLNNLLPIVGYDKIKKLYLKVKDIKFSSLDDYKIYISTELKLPIDEINFYFDPQNATSMFKEY